MDTEDGELEKAKKEAMPPLESWRSKTDQAVYQYPMTRRIIGCIAIDRINPQWFVQDSKGRWFLKFAMTKRKEARFGTTHIIRQVPPQYGKDMEIPILGDGTCHPNSTGDMPAIGRVLNKARDITTPIREVIGRRPEPKP